MPVFASDLVFGVTGNQSVLMPDQAVSIEVRQVERDHYDLVGIRQITEPI